MIGFWVYTGVRPEDELSFERRHTYLALAVKTVWSEAVPLFAVLLKRKRIGYCRLLPTRKKCC